MSIIFRNANFVPARSVFLNLVKAKRKVKFKINQIVPAFVHVICGLCTPGAKFTDNVKMDAISIDDVDQGAVSKVRICPLFHFSI